MKLVRAVLLARVGDCSNVLMEFEEGEHFYRRAVCMTDVQRAVAKDGCETEAKYTVAKACLMAKKEFDYLKYGDAPKAHREDALDSQEAYSSPEGQKAVRLLMGATD